MTKNVDALIIGGGISGLSTAWWLAQRGIHSIVLERAQRTGGVIDSTEEGGYLTDHAASMILNFDHSVDKFIQSSGLSDQRVMRNQITQRYLIKQGKLISVPNSLIGLMTSDFFSVTARKQMLTEFFKLGRPAHWESVADFVRRRLGQEILDMAIDPYVSAVLACDPEKACARSTLPRLTSLEKRFKSLTMGVLLKKLILGKRGLPQQAFTFAGGMKTLVETLSQNPLCNIHLNQQVGALEPLKNGWRVSYNDGEQERKISARHIILATPANVAAALLKPVHSELSGLLGQVRYAPMAQIHLGFEHSDASHAMQGSGFLVPSHETSIPVRGSLWTSNLVGNRVPQNRFLTSNYIGGACQPGALEQPDNILVDQSLSALHKLCGLQTDPEMVRINRHAQGLPLYHGQYAALSESILANISKTNGLHIVSNYLHGISIRDRIIQSGKVATAIGQALSTRQKSGKVYSALAFQESG
ncbi:MAG: protoporphyrinogen oxidase [Gammaproteobacteria bacterium]|nr:protoporphyrinogen oxidase [Gammaproteobacteria bacterium]